MPPPWKEHNKLRNINTANMAVRLQQDVRSFASSHAQTVAVDCHGGAGMSDLFAQIHGVVASQSVDVSYLLPYSSPSQALLSQLLDMGSLCKVHYLDIGVAISGKLPNFAQMLTAALAQHCLAALSEESALSAEVKRLVSAQPSPVANPRLVC